MTDKRNDEMPEEIYVGFTGDQRFPTCWTTGQSLVGRERTKYTRADLSPPVPDDVAEAIKRANYTFDGSVASFGRLRAIDIETLIRYAQEKK